MWLQNPIAIFGNPSKYIYWGVPHKSPTKVKLILRSEQNLFSTTVPKFTSDFYGTPKSPYD